jgi:hypothetical protein
VFSQPRPAGRADRRRDQAIGSQYEIDPGAPCRRIDENVAKGEKVVDGKCQRLLLVMPAALSR